MPTIDRHPKALKQFKLAHQKQAEFQITVLPNSPNITERTPSLQYQCFLFCNSKIDILNLLVHTFIITVLMWCYHHDC